MSSDFCFLGFGLHVFFFSVTSTLRCILLSERGLVVFVVHFNVTCIADIAIRKDF